MTARRFTQAVILSVCSVVLACATDRVSGPAPDDLAARIRALGFNPAGFEDHGDYVVVEGDIVLKKEALFGSEPDAAAPNKIPNRPTYQYYTNQIVSRSYVKQIVVNLSGLSGISDWATAARNAIADYNAAGSLIHMSEGSPGDISFSTVYQFTDPNQVGQATWPYQGSPSGKPGPTITIATFFNGLSLGEKEWFMVHELGHTVGLRHNNAQATEQPGTAGINFVTGTVADDPSSVMIPVNSGFPFSGFSYYDIIALKTLYNPIEMTIVGPSYLAWQRNCTWTVNASGAVPPYTYSWNVQPPASGSFWPGSGSNQSFTTYTSSYTGPLYLTVTVTDATGWNYTNATTAQVYGFGGPYDHTYCT